MHIRSYELLATLNINTSIDAELRALVKFLKVFFSFKFGNKNKNCMMETSLFFLAGRGGGGEDK
jgi:hypothetical protein